MTDVIEIDDKQVIQDYVDCRQDPVYFLNKFAKIVHPTKGKIPFETYEFQNNCVEDFIKHRFNVILKSRQMGISTIVAGYIAWLIRFYKNKQVLVIATDRDVAQNLIIKVRTIFDNLPEHLQPRKPYEKDNTQLLGLSNGSWVKAVGTTKKAGRSEGLSLLVMDEAAWIEWADEIWAAAEPTLSTGGNAIILSTPAGMSGLFYDIYTEAADGLNGFNTVFLPWYLHPDRDEAWYKEARKKHNKKKFAREYDCSFEASGDTVIDSDDIKFYNNSFVCEPKYKTNFDKNLWIWKETEPGKKYLVSADVARGDGEDYSAFHVIDVVAYEQAAEYKGKLPPDEFGYMLKSIGEMYNNALIVVENATVGYATLQKLIDLKYKNIYYTSKTDKPYVDDFSYKKKTKDLVPGFSTTPRTRPLIVSKLEEDIRNKEYIIHSSRTAREMETFIFLNGKPQAMEGKNDDLLLSAAIGMYVRATSLKLFQASEFINKTMLFNTTRDITKFDDMFPQIKLEDPRAMDPIRQTQDMYEYRFSMDAPPEKLDWLL